MGLQWGSRSTTRPGSGCTEWWGTAGARWWTPGGRQVSTSPGEGQGARSVSSTGAWRVGRGSLGQQLPLCSCETGFPEPWFPRLKDGAWEGAEGRHRALRRFPSLAAHLLNPVQPSDVSCCLSDLESRFGSRGKGGFSAPLCFDLPPSSGVSDLSGFWRQETTTDVINMAEVLSFKKPESETFPVAWASWFRKAPGVPYSRVLGGPFPCRLMEAGAREMPGGRTRGGVLSLCPPFRRPHVPTTRDGGRDSWG